VLTEEMAAVLDFNASKQAVVDKRFGILFLKD